MSATRAFFDTNVLLYLYSGAEPAKKSIAREFLGEYAERDEAIISTQVVQEFYVVGGRKMAIPEVELRAAVTNLLELPLVTIGPMEILRAIEKKDRYMVSFWDALILSAAESADAEILFTEDLNHNQRYGSVTVRNPFLDSALPPA